MKNSLKRLVLFCLVTGLAVVSTLVIVSCGSNAPATTTTTTTGTYALSSIAIVPTPNVLTAGATQQFTAIGVYLDGNSHDITAQVTWASDTPGIATVSSAGLVTAVAVGSAKITAALSGVSSAPTPINVISVSVSTTTTTAATTTTPTVTTTTSATSP